MASETELRKLHANRLRAMVSAIGTAQRRIQARTLAALSAAMDEPAKGITAGYWSGRLGDITALYDLVAARFISWAGNSKRGSIVHAVRDGERLAERVMAEAADMRRKFKLPYDTKTINAFVEDTAVTITQATESGKAFTKRLFRATQQDLLRESEINRSLTASQLERAGGPRRFASDLATQLRARAQDGKFLTINGRNYQIDKYAELVARTRTREAQSIGTIRTTREYGGDAVRWIAYGGACPICSPYDKKIFSLDPGGEHPELQKVPPLHPHCLCVIVPYIGRASTPPTAEQNRILTGAAS